MAAFRQPPPRRLRRIACGALLVAAGVLPWDSTAEANPRALPLDHTPYQYDDEAAPTPVGFYIGTGMLLVVLGVMTYEIRRRRRRDDRSRWLAVHPDARHDETIDPWLVQEAVETGRAHVRNVDDAWGARDPARLRELLAPALAERWERALATPGDGGAHRRLDEEAPVRVSFVTELGAPAGRQRVVLHVGGSVRDAGEAVAWSPVRRLARLLPWRGTKRTFAEFWTLERVDERWVLAATQPDRTASPSRAPRTRAPWSTAPAAQR